MARHSLVNTLLVPALVGLCVALMVLLWAPGWVTPLQPALPAANDTTTASVLTTDSQTADSGDVIVQPTVITSYADAVERAAPAVVNIYTSKVVRRKLHPLYDDPLFRRFFQQDPEPDERIQSSLGSGVIMTSDGYILTNNHVIKDADQIVVALHDGRESKATLIGTDPEADLALLKITLDQLPHITAATSQKLRVGDVVLAIGNPFGVGQTVTQGIVSATGRNQLGLNTYENYIQTDAAINPGNSGGALINARGELVGINTAIYSQSGGSEGIGFAIPVELAERTVKDISEHGVAIRGWLGIEVQEATPKLLSALALPDALKGLIVTGIYEDGPADHSGMTVGDIIVKINELDASDARASMNQIAALRPGDKIQLEFIRDGKLTQTEAIAGQRGQPPSS
ncbi:trypsin-like peptidase domain-containing protein [Oceanobacter mangrovi]|uniref:trypsin-like peptidase domain-containing protein n=1 Tax=Oceanobacter mangrovi TaxID=2862510 RepID=UPI001C8DFE85|nr:trypsin-like peptidase domain-containing protein [Oceanobacter mangrovi]